MLPAGNSFALAKTAIQAGKAVFVEKPLVLNGAQGAALFQLVQECKGLLTVGFNRRFSPLAIRLREELARISAPKSMIYRINAGPLAADHWLLDPEQGGGRLLGEAVHFVDLLIFLAGSYPIRRERISSPSDPLNEASIQLIYDDGSMGILIYSGRGTLKVPKERLEVLSDRRIWRLDDFKLLTMESDSGLKTLFSSRNALKGQSEQLRNFYEALRGQAELGVTVADGYWATRCLEAGSSGELGGPAE